MSDAIVSWFSNMNGYTAVFFMSMLPIVELRGSIIFAAATDLPYVWAYIISVVGNMIPIPFVILFLRPILNWLKTTKHLSGAANWVQERSMKKAGKIVVGGKDMYIIAGLGNPGKQYAQTRHNVGFDTIDILADKYNISVDTKKHKALCGKGMIEGQKVVLAKPQTFMNLSGESVRELVDFYKIDPEEELIVIYDDISLEPGQLRIRPKGSAGGHNGIKNIIAHLGTQVFKRVKVGVGEKPKGSDNSSA